MTSRPRSIQTFQAADTASPAEQLTGSLDRFPIVMAGWVDRIRAKIRGNILLPPDLAGNPEAVFEVTLMPTGEVLNHKLKKSSGHRGYDDAIERAILKSSPLPKPDQAGLFERQLELRFRPQDK